MHQKNNNDVGKIVRKTYDQIAEKYHQRWGEYSGFFLRNSKEFIKNIPSGGKILDLGCGTGRDSRWFSEKGFDVTGIDFSKGMLKIAKRIAPKAKFILQDISRSKIDERFDGVWCSFVLLHLRRKDIFSILRKIRKLLKKNGVLFVATKEGIGEKIEPEHLNKKLKIFETFFRTEELEKMVKCAGFKILKSRLDSDRQKSEEKIIIIYARK